jgi:hypothetical protein
MIIQLRVHAVLSNRGKKNQTSAAMMRMTALRLRYGSVLLTAWVHGSVNSQARGIWALLFMGVHPLLGGVVGLPGLVVLGLVGAWLLARSPEPSTTAA